MKLESLLVQLATFGALLTTAGLALDALALTLFCGWAALLVVLIMTGDYSSRSSYAAALATVTRRAEVMPLAA